MTAASPQGTGGGRRLPSREALWTLGVALAAAAFTLPIWNRWFALLDEGYILEIADEINRGKVLYRDVNVDAPFPGAFYLLAAWFRIAGASIASSRVLAIAGFSLYVTALFRIARSLLSRRAALLFVGFLLCYRVWAFPHWHIYSYSLVAAALAVVGVATALRALRRDSMALLGAAGLALGAAAMCKQDYGLAVAGTTGLALLLIGALGARSRLARLAPAAAFSLGLAAVLLPSLAAFAWAGALGDLVRQAILVPLSGALGFHYTRLPALWPLFSQDPALRAEIGSYFPSILATLWWYPCPGCWASELSRGWLYQSTAFWDATLKLVYWAPLGAALTAAALWLPRAIRTRREPASSERRGEMLLLACAGGFLLAFNRPRDWVHLMMVTPPAALVGAVLLARSRRRLRGRGRVLLAAAPVSALAALAIVTLALMGDLRRRIDWWIGWPRGGAYIDAQNGPVIEDALGWVQRSTEPGEPLPVYPVQPMLGFLAGRESAGGFHVIWPVQAPERDRRIIADFERRRIGHVVYSLSQYAHLGRFQENAPQLFDYLVDHFEIAAVFSRVPNGPLLLGLERRRPGPGRPLADEPATVTGAGWMRWPFGRVLAQIPGATARLALRLPAGPVRLELSFGVDPDRWLDVRGGPFTFRAAVAPEAGAPRELLRRRIDPRWRVADRRWHPAALDLSRWAGRRIEVRLRIEAAGPGSPPDAAVAGWLEPRLVPTAPPRPSGLEAEPTSASVAP